MKINVIEEIITQVIWDGAVQQYIINYAVVKHIFSCLDSGGRPQWNQNM